MIRYLCPHADPSVISRLRRLGLRRKLANYLWVEFLMARGSSRLYGGRPYWLTIDPSNFCQLHCPFCPTGANRGVRDKSRMNLAHFKKLMDRLGPALLHMDMMNWGESLLNPDLPEMIAYAKRFGVEVRLDANFNDVSESAVEKLVLSGLDIIGISIDGLTQETYGKYRVGGSLEKALRNLAVLVGKRRELGRSSPQIIFQYLVFRHNEHELGQVEAFARARGADLVDIKSPYMPSEPGYLWEWLARDPRYQTHPLPPAPPDAEQVDGARRGVHAKEIAPAMIFRARRFQPRHIYRRAFLRELWNMSRAPKDLLWSARRLARAALEIWRQRRGLLPGAAKPAICKWPWAAMTVNPEGSVSPCCSIEDQGDDFGNVFEEKWESLWEGKRYRQSRRHVSGFIAGTQGVLPGADHACQRCTLIGRVNFDFPATWNSEEAGAPATQ